MASAMRHRASSPDELSSAAIISIAASECSATFVTVKGARLVDENQHELKAQALSLWIDATLLNMIPNLRKEVKARLNLWDYVGYDG